MELQRDCRLSHHTADTICHHVDGDGAAGAGAVVHDKRLAESLGELLPDQPRDTFEAGMMGNSEAKNK